LEVLSPQWHAAVDLFYAKFHFLQKNKEKKNRDSVSQHFLLQENEPLCGIFNILLMTIFGLFIKPC